MVATLWALKKSVKPIFRKQNLTEELDVKRPDRQTGLKHNSFIFIKGDELLTRSLLLVLTLMTGSPLDLSMTTVLSFLSMENTS